MATPLWTPSEARMAPTHMRAFMRLVTQRTGQSFADYDALHAWSVAEPEAFWTAAWDYCGIVAETRGETVIADKDKIPGARFFPEARLNFAEKVSTSLCP